MLLEKFIDEGLVMAVTPGTSLVTVGGAIANDVHGKNHDLAGSIGAHVNWIDIVGADGAVQRVSRTVNSDIFDATVGGIGLTGAIVRASVTLKNLESNSVIVTERRISCLEEFLDELRKIRGTANYSVGWIDALRSGQQLGRGILETAESSHEFIRKSPRQPSNLPFDFPNFAINSFSVRTFNTLYFRRIPAEGRKRVVAFDRFVYPLDAVGQWNRMYGKRGFFQFQCVLPDETSFRGLKEMLRIVSDSGNASFLAVLKTLGERGSGKLSFPMPGFTLALDIPNRAGSVGLLHRLEALTLEHGGRVYLAKDAALSQEGFREMYPQYRQFMSICERIDRTGKFKSDMARRLGLK
jgi:decaprenylphospho-beta-D-ribofuranose 2-oxidase